MDNHAHHEMRGSYRRFAAEMAIDFVIMYFVMFTMIATLDHFYHNINNVYMTLMMVAPMSILMLIFMRSMYRSKRLNIIVISTAVLVFLASFVAMRTQAGVGDKEFLKSMIPHHSGAVLMCEEASLTDPEILAMCRDIVSGQRDEIARMEAILERL